MECRERLGRKEVNRRVVVGYSRRDYDSAAEVMPTTCSWLVGGDCGIAVR